MDANLFQLFMGKPQRTLFLRWDFSHLWVMCSCIFATCFVCGHSFNSCGLGARFYAFGYVFAWSTGFCRGLQEVHGTWSPGAPFHCGGSFQSINILVLPKRKTANHSEVLNTLNLYRFNFYFELRFWPQPTKHMRSKLANIKKCTCA